jgi:hypothetical protein
LLNWQICTWQPPFTALYLQLAHFAWQIFKHSNAFLQKKHRKKLNLHVPFYYLRTHRTLPRYLQTFAACPATWKRLYSRHF